METPEGGPSHVLLRGRYRLNDVIGAGGMATVYRASDELLGRDVAVKVFRTAAVDQKDIDQQEGEIKLLARLNHPGLVTVIDAGAHLGDPAHPQLFLVMELVQGDDLRVRLARPDRSPSWAPTSLRRSSTSSTAAWCTAISSRPISSSPSTAHRTPGGAPSSATSGSRG